MWAQLYVDSVLKDKDRLLIPDLLAGWNKLLLFSETMHAG